MKPQVHFISAGAGSGKTFRITEILFDELSGGHVRPEAVIATTFTKKAAAELVERVRLRLAEQFRHDLAASLGQSMIGTVNSVCGRILIRYAFEAGLSPELEVLDEEAGKLLFGQALEQAVDLSEIRQMNALAKRLGQTNWKEEVKKVVDLARANNLAPSELPAQASQSVKEYLAFFPKPCSRNLDAELRQAMEQAIEDIADNGDTTKTTGKYLDLLKGALRKLTHGGLPWSQWVKLSKESPAKRSLDSAQAVLDVALAYDYHPRLHDDLKQWTLRIFSLADKAMECYSAFKAERGLMDFVDQEQKVLHLLDRPEVADSLREELDLLLVDEFQDTSPIQLAVFLKLAGLARNTVWVGDVKQAIYGFRGCDPDLMNAVVRNIRSGGREVEILDKSWRSRPPLVHLVNDLFVPAFSGTLEEAEVSLLPARKDIAQHSAVDFWILEGSNQAKRANALARGIEQLFAEKRQVVDKKTQTLRPLRFNDVAVLCRTNAKAAAYAQALADGGLPVALAQSGLLNTPEVCLAVACLRRMLDPSDTLASAEIVALTGAARPEEWLQDRLTYLDAGGASRTWGLEGDFRHPVLMALEKERANLGLLSPCEALSRAIWVAEIERSVQAWGPNAHRAEQRQANIEVLQALAEQYEDICRQQRSAATIGGLILWLQDLGSAELDQKGLDPGADAIHVSTHHGAKGLEWPVVICCDLETGIKPGIWGLNMMHARSEVDLQNPLEGRRLSYWVWPFEKQSAGIRVADIIENSSVGLNDREVCIEEAKRLLYVSMTRARDLLVLPFSAKSKATPWLDTLQASWLSPSDEVLTLPSGETAPCKTRTLSFSEEPDSVKVDAELSWFPLRKPTSEKLPAAVSPSSVDPVVAQTARVIVLGGRIPVVGRPDMDRVGTALHDVFAADLGGGLVDNREAKACALLKRYQLAEHIEAAEVLACSSSLREWLEKTFVMDALYPEWPIRTVLDSGQRVQGWVDLLIDTADGWVLVDHKSFPGKKEHWEKHALEYAGQLDLYRRAVEQATGKPVRSQWIHFCIGGGLVEIKLMG
jgi:ATP-dependent exoDNAse (exonuclease V) beta subunit